MSYQSYSHFARVPIDAGRQLAQLSQVLRLVEELSGEAPRPHRQDAALNDGAEISSIYWDALPVVQRRFDALAAETATWSAAAVEALLSAGEERSPAAARMLAGALHQALGELTSLLRH